MVENDKIERLLPVTGPYNMRDLGGYKTKDNKQIKWRTIIRSGDLNDLTESDLEYLNNLPLKTIVDLRSDFERNAVPDKAPDSTTTEFWVPIDAGDLSRLNPDAPEDIVRLMENVYENIIINFQDELKQFFRIAEDMTKAPFLFHCSAGKDRTGITSALLLSALGIENEIIMEDYMLSAEYIKGKYDHLIEKYPDLEPLVTVRPEYLRAAFRIIDEKYNGVGSYLKNNLDVNVELLKGMYTE